MVDSRTEVGKYKMGLEHLIMPESNKVITHTYTHQKEYVKGAKKSAKGIPSG